MTEQHLDLSNLREALDGDKELEQELFEEFQQSSRELLVELEGLCDGGNEEWRKAAHALKGISVNLGAFQLGEIAKDAQDKFESGSDEKQGLCQALSTELGTVLDCLETA